MLATNNSLDLRAKDELGTLDTRGLLRFLTCGSVDDGKSTLIGRLLFETGAIYQDQIQSVERDSKKHGATGNEIDLSASCRWT